jgi:hypothetical protein
MFARSSGAMRRSFLGFLVADLTLLLGICALAFRQPFLRLGLVSAAVLFPWCTFAVTHGSLARLAVAEWRSHRRRSLSCLAAVLFGTAALTVALSARFDPDLAGRAAATAFGGPVDLVMEAPDEAKQAAARDVLDTVRSRADLQPLFDEEPLEVRLASAWIDVGSIQRVRVIALDPTRVKLFGGDARWSGFAAAASVDGVTIDTEFAASLGVKVGSSVNVLTSTASVPVPVLQVLPKTGLLGLPGASGLPTPTMFVDPTTFAKLRAEGWNDPIRYWSLISLCGAPVAAASVVADALPTPIDASTTVRRCESEPYGSRVLVERVEEELTAALDSATTQAGASATDDSPEVLFDSDGAAESETPYANVRVHPIKLTMLKSQIGIRDRWLSDERALVGLLSTGALALTTAACFVDRRRRTARERMLGFSTNMIHGVWTGVILFSVVPGAILGSGLGAIIAGFAGRAAFGRSNPLWESTFQPVDLFTLGLSWSFACCAAMGLLISIMTQRIPLLNALRGAPLMTSKRWIAPGSVLLVGGCLIAIWSRLLGWRGPVAVLMAGTGGCLLAWALARSKRLVGVGGALMSLVGLFVLRRGWSDQPQAATAVALVVFGAIVVIGGIVGSYVSAGPGRYVARFGVPRADAPTLSVLKTRVATRPGPWPLLPVVGATMAMVATATAVAVVLASGTRSPQAGQRNALVLQEFEQGTVRSVASMVPSLATGSIADIRWMDISVSFTSPDPEVPEPIRRRVAPIASLPNDATQRVAMVGQVASAGMAPSDSEGVIVVAEVFRSTIGTVPPVGSLLIVRSDKGIDRALTVRAIIERSVAPGGLLINDPVADSLLEGDWQHRGVAVFAGKGGTVPQLEKELKAALLGRKVGNIDSFRIIPTATSRDVLLRLLLRFVLLFEVLAAGMLVWRWADERRRLLVSSRSAAIGPAYLARSINQDATAHVGSVSLLGALAGVGLGWVLRQPGTQFQLPWVMLLVVVTVPTLVASVVARFPSSWPSGTAASKA